MSFSSAWLNDFQNLFFPHRCAACEKPLSSREQILCLNCELRLPVTGYKGDRENPVSEVFWGRINLQMATSFLFFNKGGLVQRLIHQLKYRHKKQIGFYLGRKFGLFLENSPLIKTIDVILPVPLHPQKEKERGYNQSVIIAGGISQILGIPVVLDNLFRSKYTDSQTKMTRYSRWENVRNVFKVSRPEELRGKHVLLLDDVLTTGATLEACANQIAEHPQTKISVATIAYAQD